MCVLFAVSFGKNDWFLFHNNQRMRTYHGLENDPTRTLKALHFGGYHYDIYFHISQLPKICILIMLTLFKERSKAENQGCIVYR